MSFQGFKCHEQGFFGTEDGCAACPPGTFSIDPLAPCNATKATPEQCCTDSYVGWNSTRICQDDSLFENNLQLFRRGPRRHNTWCPSDSKHSSYKSTPWLFDVARLKGYITYFGEEFCYNFSPYVSQDNTFPLHTDYELRNVHCRLESCKENCEGPWPPMGPHLCVEHELENPAFSQLGAMWKAYPDVPKFAFLNAFAAHDLGFEWIKMISSLEAYDDQLASHEDVSVVWWKLYPQYAYQHGTCDRSKVEIEMDLLLQKIRFTEFCGPSISEAKLEKVRIEIPDEDIKPRPAIKNST